MSIYRPFPCYTSNAKNGFADWEGAHIAICLNTGMNMKSAQDSGTNADGTPNGEYCNYCYQNGAFTRDVTMDEWQKPFIC